jgi:DNA replication protein DnaC
MADVRCWAEEYCAKRGEEGACHPLCVGYVLLEALYEQSMIPKIYQYPMALKVEKVDAGAYGRVKEYIADVVRNIEMGKGLYLWGRRTGTGKTSLACVVANVFLRKKAFVASCECMVVFLHVPSFLEEYRRAYDYKEEEALRWVERMEDVWNAPLVIWDDIGAEKPSEWVRERLLTIIDYRVGKGLANIFTSNRSIEELAVSEVLGSRISSRIRGCTEELHLVGVDKRGKENG